MLTTIITILLGMSIFVWGWIAFIFTVFTDTRYPYLRKIFILLELSYPIATIFTMFKINTSPTLVWLWIPLVIAIITIIFYIHMGRYIRTHPK